MPPNDSLTTLEGRRPLIEDDLKKEDDLKNEDNLKNEKDLKNEDLTRYPQIKCAVSPPPT